jgi:hypothetical protein
MRRPPRPRVGERCEHLVSPHASPLVLAILDQLRRPDHGTCPPQGVGNRRPVQAGLEPRRQACLRKGGAGPVTWRPRLQDRMVQPVFPARHALAGCFKFEVQGPADSQARNWRLPSRGDLSKLNYGRASLLIFVCALAFIPGKPRRAAWTGWTRQLKALKDENAKLKKRLAEAMLEGDTPESGVLRPPAIAG